MNNTKNIFNTEKDYKSGAKLVLGQPLGLFDTINKPFPEIWNLYKQAVEQNWSEDEFDFSPCKREFAMKDDAADMMVETLSWQWEADSVVAHTLLPILAPFITSDELSIIMAFNTYIEGVHSATYSEIVRNGFDDPDETLDFILKNQEALERVSIVGEVLQELHDIGHKYALGQLTKEEVFPTVYLGVVALYLLERLQFIASFAITFTLGESGAFQPIAMAVRKICSDEVQIHATADTMILRDMRKDPLYKNLCDNPEFKAKVKALVDDVEQGEMEWTEHLFRDGRTIVGINCNLIKDWVTFNAQVVRDELEIPFEREVEENPIPWINNWLTMNNLQAAPQEQDIAAYKIGGVKDDIDEEEWDF